MTPWAVAHQVPVSTGFSRQEYWSGWSFEAVVSYNSCFPGGANGKEPSKEMQVQSLGQEDPWRRKWQPTPVFLPGESHGQKNLVGYSPWGQKESDTTESNLALAHN